MSFQHCALHPLFRFYNCPSNALVSVWLIMAHSGNDEESIFLAQQPVSNTSSSLLRITLTLSLGGRALVFTIQIIFLRKAECPQPLSLSGCFLDWIQVSGHSACPFETGTAVVSSTCFFQNEKTSGWGRDWHMCWRQCCTRDSFPWELTLLTGKAGRSREQRGSASLFP